jgi:hypothetical protein
MQIPGAGNDISGLILPERSFVSTWLILVIFIIFVTRPIFNSCATMKMVYIGQNNGVG